jgi:hypothetical protein
MLDFLKKIDYTFKVKLIQLENKLKKGRGWNDEKRKSGNVKKKS